MSHQYTAKEGDTILDKAGRVVAYFAQAITLNGPRLFFMPRLPMSMLVSPEEALPHDVGFTKHEVHLAWAGGDFRVWRWAGEGDPEEAFGGNYLFTLKRPEGDVAAAIRVLQGDRQASHMLQSVMIDGHLNDYACYLEERKR